VAEPTGALARIANRSCQADPFAVRVFVLMVGVLLVCALALAEKGKALLPCLFGIIGSRTKISNPFIPVRLRTFLIDASTHQSTRHSRSDP
jgi:hypothetical protein